MYNPYARWFTGIWYLTRSYLVPYVFDGLLVCYGCRHQAAPKVTLLNHLWLPPLLLLLENSLPSKYSQFTKRSRPLLSRRRSWQMELSNLQSDPYLQPEIKAISEFRLVQFLVGPTQRGFLSFTATTKSREVNITLSFFFPGYRNINIYLQRFTTVVEPQKAWRQWGFDPQVNCQWYHMCTLHSQWFSLAAKKKFTTFHSRFSYS